MIIFLFLLILIVFLGLGTQVNNDFVFSKSVSTSLKGIGIIVVFFDHILGYIKQSGYQYSLLADIPFVYCIEQSTQLFVSLFLFISGFGVQQSIKRNGIEYVQSIPKKRIATTFINFGIAVLFYIILNHFLHIKMEWSEILLSFLAWDSIGNSNWYIFCILFCYLFAYIGSFLNSYMFKIKGWYVTLFLVFIYIYIISNFKEPWWYQTILAFVAGQLYSEYSNSINTFIQKYFIKSLLLSLFCLILFYLKSGNAICMNIASISFCFSCVILTTKYTINSKLLDWCGSHLFLLYIYQRIPMIFLSTLFPAFVYNYPLLYILLCMIGSVSFAKLMPLIKLNSKL